MTNLRLPEHRSAADYQALIATVLGVPDRVIDPLANTHGLTLEQRWEWWKLVRGGHDVNISLMIVRGLL